MEKVIPIGYEDIKRIIDRNLYYVDKSLMIKDLVDSAASVNLFTRPRRFGKTLNLSMIRRFLKPDRSPLIKALEDGDCLVCEEFISQQLVDTISYFDYAETYYQGFLSGLLKGMKNYRVYSNRESGNGRPDIILKTPSVRGCAIVLELKIAKRFQDMESICDEGLLQIKKNDYEAALRSEGYRNIKSYALCFYRKECMVKAV